jgi:hypothetical protein
MKVLCQLVIKKAYTYFQVCEVYRLHRETCHLAKALNFVDRYLATESELPKKQLKLIGMDLFFLVKLPIKAQCFKTMFYCVSEE